MKTDYQWLELWENRIRDKSVLELGAGEGIDSAYLRKHADSLVSTDLNPNEELDISYLDHSEPLPLADNAFDLVIASLTLHYFKWGLTQKIVKELSRVLKKGGLLICRVNSVNDSNYGATGYPEVEPRLYQVKGQLKRFFTEEDIVELFDNDWGIERIEEKQIDRYKYAKMVWEFEAINF